MTTPTDKRLIEDYIPIKKISEEASREKSIRHGHISTLHLWWARRPLVAARAAVFGALVPADAKPQLPKSPGSPDLMSLNDLMIALCKWKVSEEVLDEARRLIREAHPDGPPKVLDMFAGGGSIPLEALRLGCEAYALDLNPVAHIIELATLVYPQKYGPQLAEDVRKWGEWVLERVRAEVGDLYPLIPDPDYTAEDASFLKALPKQRRLMPADEPEQLSLDDAAQDIDADGEDDDSEAAPADIPPGYLQPVAYLWTRTVTCPNPACRATVPLVRQTWLKKKKGDNVALEMKPHPTENRMAFHVRHAADPADFGFDPAGFSQRGNSVCGRCGTTVTSNYVKVEGKAKRIAAQMMATVCVRPRIHGKVYLSPDDMMLPIPDEGAIQSRIEQLTTELGIAPPNEVVSEDGQHFQAPIYGMKHFVDLFTPRQMLALLTFAKHIRAIYYEMSELSAESDYVRAITTNLGLILSRLTNFCSALCVWYADGGRGVRMLFARQAIPMIWDYAETNPFNPAAASWNASMRGTLDGLRSIECNTLPAHVERGSATAIPVDSQFLDAVVTDPPYYDNVAYSDLSDYFYVWLSRSIGFLYPEHFSTELTPKKNEAISAPYRHDGKVLAARTFYEKAMAGAFAEANRVLKPSGSIVTIYAHKTTVGWSTLIDAMRTSGFTILEAWPIETEQAHRSVSLETAALASSIFLIGRKRDTSRTGNYDTDVLPNMQRIVKERVSFFLKVGVTGADLNIATVGAGLAPYTRYTRVELPNGDELTAAAYLDAVQAEVVRVLLGEAANVDKATQYYIIARQNYGEAWVDFDEANNLARATGIELDTGPNALTRGRAALVEKKGAKVRLHDYTERGDDQELGQPTPERVKASLIDVLHRLLWLAEHDNGEIESFLNGAMPDKYLLRVVAQSLSGKALAAEPTPGAVRDERTTEQRAISTLLASWRRVVEEGKFV